MTNVFLCWCLPQTDLANLQKKKDEEKANAAWIISGIILLSDALVLIFILLQALKDLKAKASQKGTFGGTGLKKSGKKWECSPACP